MSIGCQVRSKVIQLLLDIQNKLEIFGDRRKSRLHFGASLIKSYYTPVIEINTYQMYFQYILNKIKLTILKFYYDSYLGIF